jgi:Amt family ammonium transporter
VHLVNGIWGTFAVGLFAIEGGLFTGGGLRLALVQSVGILTFGILSLLASGSIWLLLKFTIGIRVSTEEEREGLDLGEHGIEAYPGLTRGPAPHTLEVF